jgi:DNA polymerase III alpha subunit
MDIEEWVREQTPPWDPEHGRVEQELRLFNKHNMIPVLNAMKYIVDTLRANNIVWGVGRGSSVASYVLHIIGVHKIDSVKYNIPIEEFFKEI